MKRAKLLACVVLVTLSGLWAIAAPPARARTVARTVRMEGYVGAAPEGVRPQAEWTINIGKKPVVFQLTRLQIITGPGSPSDVIQALRPYRAASFRVVGDEKRLAQITDAAAGSRIVLRGNLRLAPARTLLLDTVEIG